jgi:membrane associated rhomboid family serine protease
MSAPAPWLNPARGDNSLVGIYDRDYYRQEPQPGASSYAPRTIVGALVAVNVALWIADSFSSETPGGRWLSDHMAVHVGTLTQPWLWWQYLTAGFAHSPLGFDHILGNMLVLFFLGRDVEETYGPKEFLRLYLVTLVFANVVWNVATWMGSPPTRLVHDYGAVVARQIFLDHTQVYGASGAIAGLVVLYALNFPHRTLLLFFVIPMPAWVLGVFVVAYDIYGATVGVAGSNVAFSVHLAGAAFAFAYYQRQWNLTRLTAGRIAWPSFRRKPHLRIHKPEDTPHPDLNAEVDRLLEKIYREGEASLTAKERKTLETASREYQRRGEGRDERGEMRGER